MFPEERDVEILKSIITACDRLDGSASITRTNASCQTDFWEELGLERVAALAGHHWAKSNSDVEVDWYRQKASLGVLFRRADENRLKYYVVRGAECTERLYGGRSIGKRGDVDILIDPQFIDTWRHIAKSVGFEEIDSDHEFELTVLSVSPSLGQELGSSPDCEVITSVRIELLSSLADFGIRSATLTRWNEPSSFFGGRSLSASASVWYTAAYFHRKLITQERPSILALVDLIFWVEKFKIDWCLVAELAAESRSIEECGTVFDFLLTTGLSSEGSREWAKHFCTTKDLNKNPIEALINSAWKAVKKCNSNSRGNNALPH